MMAGIPFRPLVVSFPALVALQIPSDLGTVWLLIALVAYVIVTLVLLFILWRLYTREVTALQSRIEEREKTAQEALATLEEERQRLRQVLRGAELTADLPTDQPLDLEEAKVEPEASETLASISRQRVHRVIEDEGRHSLQRKTIAEVGRTITAVLEMDTLLPQVVELIAQNLGYYHVHIFQVDPGSEYAIYKAGAGKAGPAIGEEGLRLKVGEEGIIGWVARHGQPLLVNDVSQEPRYYPHPALPDTRSELAVPIRVGRKVIGVLGVQSEELNTFDEGDLATLEALAYQLAVAMENARLYQETKHLAITDGLTGLYNLRCFYETLEKEIQQAEWYDGSVSLIILDIDDFKAYNDLYGHLAGDDLLIELAQLMSRVTRRSDTLARYGGEEFAIILPWTEIDGATFLAGRLQQGVRGHRFSLRGGQTAADITISMGMAAYPDHADDAKGLVDAADNALSQAKREGKDRMCVYEPSAAQV